MSKTFANMMVALTCVAGILPGCIAAAAATLKPIKQAELQSTVDAAIKDLMAPGAMVYLRTPQGEFLVGSGTTRLGAAIPPQADTHFRIASNTKTMTAAIILLLAQRGKLALDDAVSKYVRGVPNGDRLTITDLLTMRSGLYNYTDAPELANSLDRNPARAWTPSQVLTLAFSHPPMGPPGGAYSYNNTNFALLGVIADTVGGRPLAAQFQTELFAPLGMRSTVLPANTSTALPAPFSHGYLYGGAAYAVAGGTYPADLQAAARAGTLKPQDDTFQNPSYASAAGGVISTARDLATWMRALVGGKVFNATYQRRWLASLRPENPDKPAGQQYGYGITQMRFGPNTIYFHGGEMPGYNSFMGHDPGNDVTLVVWTNLTIALDGTPTANAIMLKILDQIYVDSPLGNRR